MVRCSTLAYRNGKMPLQYTLMWTHLVILTHNHIVHFKESTRVFSIFIVVLRIQGLFLPLPVAPLIIYIVIYVVINVVILI